MITIRFRDGSTREVDANNICAALEEIKKDLFRVDLHDTQLCYMDLSGAYLSCSDLRDTDLTGTSLVGADLSFAILRGTNLNKTDLTGANLDDACWPLWGGDLNAKIDERIARQLMYHVLRAMQSVKTKAAKEILSIPEVVEFANGYHRVSQYGKIAVQNAPCESRRKRRKRARGGK